MAEWQEQDQLSTEEQRKDAEDPRAAMEARKSELEDEIQELAEARDRLIAEIQEKEKESLEAKRRALQEADARLARAHEEKAKLGAHQEGPTDKKEALGVLTAHQLTTLRAQKQTDLLDSCSIEEVDAEIARRRLTKAPNEVL